MARKILFCISIVSASIISISSSAMAQIPSSGSGRTSPINYFGRFHGFGYSDGYHACKTNTGRSGTGWTSGIRMSSFYGDPTAPTAQSIGVAQPSYAPYQAIQQVNPIYNGLTPGMSHSALPATDPVQPSPVPSNSQLRVPLVPSSPPPASSPSDVSPSDMPRPKLDRGPESVSPKLEKPQAQRALSGTHSLMVSQNGQPYNR